MSSTHTSTPRRGSVLILAVGTLALLAIVVLVYSSLGQNDRRASAALVTRVRNDDAAQAIAHHIARLVGDNALGIDPVPVPPANASEPFGTGYLRHTSTYPSTDPNARSSAYARPTGTSVVKINTNYLERRFNPSGLVRGEWSTSSADPRRAAEPFLAALEPAWIPDATNLLPGTPGSGEQLMNYQRDWTHISNIAPDGRYVNLAWLRGNFHVPSGIGLDPVTNLPRTTYGLTLNTRQTTVEMDQRKLAAAPNELQRQITSEGVLADLSNPSHWSTNQLGIFSLHANDSYVAGDPRATANQWADTDGDGYPDARWQELVDAFDTDFGQNPVNLLPEQPGVRYFVAARVVDLSALANVNVATDMSEPPRAGDLTADPDPLASFRLIKSQGYTPAGLTPSDYDLSRLLSYEHAYTYWGAGLGPESYAQPFEGVANNKLLMGRYGAPNDSGYNYGDFTSSDSTFNQPALNLKLARAGVGALLQARVTGRVPGPELAYGADDAYFPGALLEGRNSLSRVLLRPDLWGDKYQKSQLDGAIVPVSETLTARGGLVTALTRKLLYERLGGGVNTESVSWIPRGIDVNGNINSQTVTAAISPFGLGDERELRTYFTANNPETTSALETALDGRVRLKNKNDPAGREFGPMRSNRGLDVERDARWTFINGATDIAGTESQASKNAWRDDLGGIRQTLTDVRHLVTTVSGARPIAPIYRPSLDVTVPGFEPGGEAFARVSDADIASGMTALLGSTSVRIGNSSFIPDGELREDLGTLVDLALHGYGGNEDALNKNQRRRAVEKLFFAAGDALLPFSAELNAWNPLNEAARPLSYGGLRQVGTTLGTSDRYTGVPCEPALRAAGHWVANLLAMRDDSDSVKGFTMLIDENYRPDIAIDKDVFPFWGDQGNGVGRRFAVKDGQVIPESSDWNDLSVGARLDLGRRTLAWSGTPQADDNTTATRRLDTLLRDGSVLRPRAINIYGVTPQPFIVQGVMNAIYRVDVDVLIPGAPGSPDKYSRVIRGDTSSNGSSAGSTGLRAEFFAVQLCNPFDRPIVLSGVSGTPVVDDQGSVTDWKPDSRVAQDAEIRYYLEFGGQCYRFPRGASTGGQLVLQPYQTRTFFMLGGSYAQASARLNINEQALKDFLLSKDGALGWDGTAGLEPVLLEQIDSRVNNFGDVIGNASDRVGVAYPQASSAIPQPRPLPGGTETDELVNKEVKLWRVVRVSPLDMGVNGQLPRNNPINDQLVDRLRDGVEGTDPEKGEQPWAIRWIGNISLEAQIANQDKRVVMFTRSVRRPTEPLSAPRYAGILPAFCYETKLTYTGINETVVAGQRRGDKSLNLVEPSSGRAIDNNLKISDESKLCYDDVDVLMTSRLGGVRKFLGTGTNNNKDDIRTGDIISMLQRPAMGPDPTKNKSDNDLTIPGDDKDRKNQFRDLVDYRGRRVQLGFPGLPWDITDKNNVRPMPGVQNPLRPADVLLPLGIGPWQNPLAKTTSGFSDVRGGEAQQVQWTTLSEALATAMNYDSPKSTEDPDWQPDQAAEPDRLASRTKPTRYDLPRETYFLFDRGQLRMDAYVPFIDADTDGTFKPIGAAGSGSTGDQTIGLGVPAALTLVDRFRTVPAGGLGKSVPGLVNINTAPMSVLTGMPMLTPDPHSWLGVEARGSDKPQIDDDVFTLMHDDMGERYTWDLAASLTGYRDRRLVWSRPYALNQQINRADFPRPDRLAYASRAAVPFFDGNDDVTTPLDAADPLYARARRVATGIPALREQRGMGSLGELLGVRVADDYHFNEAERYDAVSGKHNLRHAAGGRFDPKTNTEAAKMVAADVSIDRLGRITRAAQTDATKQFSMLDVRQNNAEQQGESDLFNARRKAQSFNIASHLYPMSPEEQGDIVENDAMKKKLLRTLPRRASAAPMTYEAKLAVANAVLAGASVRSDVFAAWFVLHGYTPADVAGLSPRRANDTLAGDSRDDKFIQPMVPSIKHRYLMILDRSNVTKPGETPRILMFEEVPYE